MGPVCFPGQCEARMSTIIATIKNMLKRVKINDYEILTTIGIGRYLLNQGHLGVCVSSSTRNQASTTLQKFLRSRRSLSQSTSIMFTARVTSSPRLTIPLSSVFIHAGGHVGICPRPQAPVLHHGVYSRWVVPQLSPQRCPH